MTDLTGVIKTSYQRVNPTKGCWITSMTTLSIWDHSRIIQLSTKGPTQVRLPLILQVTRWERWVSDQVLKTIPYECLIFATYLSFYSYIFYDRFYSFRTSMCFFLDRCVLSSKNIITLYIFFRFSSSAAHSAQAHIYPFSSLISLLFLLLKESLQTTEQLRGLDVHVIDMVINKSWWSALTPTTIP